MCNGYNYSLILFFITIGICIMQNSPVNGSSATSAVLQMRNGHDLDSKTFGTSKNLRDDKFLSLKPTKHPTRYPTITSTKKQSSTATKPPSDKPSSIPSANPTYNPSYLKSSLPTPKATTKPTTKPTFKPTSTPTNRPSSQIPTSQMPTLTPTHIPIPRSPISFRPSSRPSSEPTLSPTIPDFLTYHNGTVAVKPLNIYHVYYGKFDTQTMDLMDFLGATIGGSRYFSTVSAYYQVDSNGQRQYAASNVSFVKRAIYNKGAFNTKILSDQDFYQAVNYSIRHNNLPSDENGLYVVMFNGGFVADGWNNVTSRSTIYCGWHSVYDYRGKLLKIAVIGNPQVSANSVFGSCTFPHWPNNLPGADSMATTYAHELAEVVTDASGVSWFCDSNVYSNKTSGQGDEIADLCQLPGDERFGKLYEPVDSITSFPTFAPVRLPPNSNPADSPIDGYKFDRKWNVKLTNGSTTKYFALQMLYLNGYGCVIEPPVSTASPTSVRPSYRPSFRPVANNSPLRN